MTDDDRSARASGAANKVTLSRIESIDIENIRTGWDVVFTLDTGAGFAEVKLWLPATVEERDIVQEAGLKLHRLLHEWTAETKDRWAKG